MVSKPSKVGHHPDIDVVLVDVLRIAMDLVTRGRLSVQRVDENAWETIHLLAENGGWEEMDLKPRKKSTTVPAKAKPSKAATKVVSKKKKAKTVDEEGESPLSSLEGDSDKEGSTSLKAVKPRTTSRKRKASVGNDTNDTNPPRRSSRRRVKD